MAFTRTLPPLTSCFPSISNFLTPLNILSRFILQIRDKAWLKRDSRFLSLNLLTPKIWLLILPSSCYTFPRKLVTGIWYSDTITIFYVISLNILLPVCWIMYEYYREKLHVDHFLTSSSDWCLRLWSSWRWKHECVCHHPCCISADLQINKSGCNWNTNFYQVGRRGHHAIELTFVCLITPILENRQHFGNHFNKLRRVVW